MINVLSGSEVIAINSLFCWDISLAGCMGDTQFHFRIRCSPRSCQRSQLVTRFEDEVPLAYRVCSYFTQTSIHCYRYLVVRHVL